MRLGRSARRDENCRHDRERPGSLVPRQRRGDVALPAPPHGHGPPPPVPTFHPRPRRARARRCMLRSAPCTRVTRPRSHSRHGAIKPIARINFRWCEGWTLDNQSDLALHGLAKLRPCQSPCVLCTHQRFSASHLTRPVAHSKGCTAAPFLGVARPRSCTYVCQWRANVASNPIYKWSFRVLGL